MDSLEVLYIYWRHVECLESVVKVRVVCQIDVASVVKVRVVCQIDVASLESVVM